MDSREQTTQHIQDVRGYMNLCILYLSHCAETHDASKLHDPELAVFDEYTPKLRGLLEQLSAPES